jgi:hypothetical protein
MAKRPIRRSEIKVNVRQLDATIGPDIKPVTDFLVSAGGKIISCKFNEHELAFIDKNPISSIGGALCAALALTSTVGMPGALNGIGDATRHCLLGACMAKLLGVGTATTILNNHEIGQNNPYDANNNQVALKIGTSGALNLWGACQDAASNGSLQFKGSPSPSNTSNTSGRSSSATGAANSSGSNTGAGREGNGGNGGGGNVNDGRGGGNQGGGNQNNGNQSGGNREGGNEGERGGGNEGGMGIEGGFDGRLG